MLTTYLRSRSPAMSPAGMSRTGPGVIELKPRTHLEPDVLVFPGPIRKDFEWTDLTAHWLAVEVLSRSSKRYDCDYKRDAYLALGVPEGWLVDL